MSTLDKIKSFLTGAGFKLNTFNGHSCGLPAEAFVRVEADYSPVDGPSFLAVFPTRVVRYCLRVPYNYNDWGAHDSRSDESPDELREVVTAMSRQPQGCW